MNHTVPVESRTVNPGVTPSALASMTVHFPWRGSGGGIRPLEQLLDREAGRVPRRFVNQFESGTSSTVFTFCARTFGVLSPGQWKEFSMVRYSRSMLRSLTADASCESSTLAIGSSG